MIALAVLAIGLTAAFRLQGFDLSLVRAGQETTRSVLAAESLLWRWSVFGPPPDGLEEGEVDSFRFSAQVETDETWPGLKKVELTLKPRLGEGPSKHFQRLLAPASELR